jgi:hypothetical protein
LLRWPQELRLLHQLAEVKQHEDKSAKSALRPSINASLQNSHVILKYASEIDPNCIGSGIFSITDIYSKLRTFSDRLRSKTSKL